MRAALLVAACLLAAASPAPGYPLDGAASTGIQRLEAGRQGLRGAPILMNGAHLELADVRLRLTDRAHLERPPPDPELSRALRDLLGAEAPRYGLALLDLSDPERPLYAEHRGDARFNPGSVGKLLVAQALFQALADVHPQDLEARLRVLRETRVRADAFIHTTHHEVPIWQPGDPRVVRRRLREGDEANLYTYLDWMLSASSNGAASMVIQQLLLLRHFGAGFPASPEQHQAFLSGTPRAELSALLLDSLQGPVTRSGLDLENLRQGGFFTAEAKRRVPGSNSTSTARALIDWALRLEQGRLVDTFSSLELKRLLYLTERRIRYASSPALADAALYFKSGSLYRCKPEPDFVCLKYHGNVENMMNSVAIVEWPAGKPRLFYMVAVTSNVLRVNSAVAHQTLATRIQRLLEKRHPAPPEPAPEGASSGPAPAPGTAEAGGR